MRMDNFLKNWSFDTYGTAIREYGIKGRDAL